MPLGLWVSTECRVQGAVVVEILADFFELNGHPGTLNCNGKGYRSGGETQS